MMSTWTRWRTWSGCAWSWTDAGRRGGDAGRGVGRGRAGGDRQGRGPAVRAGRARVIPAAAGAGGAAGRAEPAAGYRVRRDGPRRGSATRCCCGTGTASGPAAAPSPPAPARCTTPRTRPTAARRPCKDCVLLCPFHHQVVIHRWGWTLVVNPDGTTTRVEQEQDQGPAQPRATRPRRVRTRHARGNLCIDRCSSSARRRSASVSSPTSRRVIVMSLIPRCALPRRDASARPGLPTASNPSESIDLLTAWLISADFVANGLREHQKGYNVRSDGGDEARCGRCYMTTVCR